MDKYKKNKILRRSLNPVALEARPSFLVPSRRPALREALTAVNRAALCRLERNLVLLATVSTDDLVHLSGTTVVSTAPLSIIQYFHSFSVRMKRTP